LDFKVKDRGVQAYFESFVGLRTSQFTAPLQAVILISPREKSLIQSRCIWREGLELSTILIPADPAVKLWSLGALFPTG
jgi:hypothetical protein